MDVANYLHWKELLRVVTFALHTQEKKIVLKPDSKMARLSLKIYMDAEFVGDQDNCKSIMDRLIPKRCSSWLEFQGNEWSDSIIHRSQICVNVGGAQRLKIYLHEPEIPQDEGEFANEFTH